MFKYETGAVFGFLLEEVKKAVERRRKANVVLRLFKTLVAAAEVSAWIRARVVFCSL